MKKTIHILFLAIFTAITLGFTVNKHYSGGELFSFALFGEPESCCDDVCDCCDEESETIQFLADYMFSVDKSDDLSSEVVLIIANVLLNDIINDIDSRPIYVNADLPPPKNSSTLSLFQSFIL